MAARALERVGDRWVLLIVRDLSNGPRRFTDLQERLGGITPKTLSMRLRELEEDGLVSVDRAPGRREVWYSLTPAGADLKPIVEDLAYWGLRHALAPPKPGEPVHPEHMFLALRILLEREHVFVDGADWVLRLVDDGTYTMRGTADGWSVAQGASDDPQVTITTTKDGWAQYLANRPEARAGMAERVRVDGSPQAIAIFMETIAAFPFGRVPPERQLPVRAICTALPTKCSPLWQVSFAPAGRTCCEVITPRPSAAIARQPGPGNRPGVAGTGQSYLLGEPPWRLPEQSERDSGPIRRPGREPGLPRWECRGRSPGPSRWSPGSRGCWGRPGCCRWSRRRSNCCSSSCRPACTASG